MVATFNIDVFLWCLIFVEIHIACQLQLPKICGMHVVLCQHYLVNVCA